MNKKFRALLVGGINISVKCIEEYMQVEGV